MSNGASGIAGATATAPNQQRAAEAGVVLAQNAGTRARRSSSDLHSHFGGDQKVEKVRSINAGSRTVAPGKLRAGSYLGDTPNLPGKKDRMSLLVKRDPDNQLGYYVILSEYERLPIPLLPEELQISSWVPRMHAYYVEHQGNETYSMRPLHVGKDGDVKAKLAGRPSVLHLGENGMEGATLNRFGPDGQLAEAISFDGSRVNSAWEDLVPGDYFFTRDSSGGDYNGTNAINTTISKEGIATFNTDDFKGQYQLTEKAPGIYSLKATKPGQLGADQVENKLAVFVDIVHWKPDMTTNELLLIDPKDPRNVGFFYERHDRDGNRYWAIVKHIWNTAWGKGEPKSPQNP